AADAAAAAIVRPSRSRGCRLGPLHDPARGDARAGRSPRRGDPVSGTEIRVPDLGDFAEVDVIEVHVAAGDRIEKDDPLITLETDKATMDVPSPEAGVVVDVRVSVGDKVSTGDTIVVLDAADAGAGTSSDTADAAAEAAKQTAGTEAASAVARGQPSDRTVPERAPGATATVESTRARSGPGSRLVVLGAGPGGYTAAFRAADLGLDVTLIERYSELGGVCLNVGCIPSKALLHAARVIEEAKEMAGRGIDFGEPRIDTAKLRDWKNQVVGQLTGGLASMARQRGVRVVQGVGRFASPHELVIEHGGVRRSLAFDQCIIAAGSEAAKLPNLPDDPRIIDSTGALELTELPQRMLVIGGGIIGLEMATVYDALGVKVYVVELTKTLIPGCDP